MNVIAAEPPPEMYATGLEIDCQCARCGSSIATESCEYCEDGYSGHDCGEDTCCCLYPEDNIRCQHCNGKAVLHQCLSSSAWCERNPLPGREEIERGEIEWFTINQKE